MTCCNAVRGGLSHGHRHHAQKNWWSLFTKFSSYASGHTDRRTQTDILINILRSRGEVNIKFYFVVPYIWLCRIGSRNLWDGDMDNCEHHLYFNVSTDPRKSALLIAAPSGGIFTLPPWRVRHTVMSMSVCLSVLLSVCLHSSKTTRSNITKFLFLLTVAVVWISSDGIAIRYVLLVLWMTTCFYIMALRRIMRIPKWWQNMTSITAKISTNFSQR